MSATLKYALCITIVSLASATSSQAHYIPWPEGASRVVAVGQCAKGACMTRVSWNEGRPHRHVGGQIIFDGAKPPIRVPTLR
ncbi:MAG: hypothetical protein ACRCS9_01945 [Hyphomicrobium sp.]